MELYTLVSWATNGTSLLGTKKEFSLRFVFPIEDGQNPNVRELPFFPQKVALYTLDYKH